jgi:hypothetical protein
MKGILPSAFAAQREPWRWLCCVVDFFLQRIKLLAFHPLVENLFGCDSSSSRLRAMAARLLTVSFRKNPFKRWRLSPMLKKIPAE